MRPALVLAIEPDRRQALQLKSIARRVGAELVVAESIERALAALTDPLPDLILTPPLLSFRDDLALTERLRELGDAAAHLQTLTIPILETAETPARGGMLSVLKRDKAPMGPIGCDANTFAEQIAVYLHEAKARRAPAGVEPPAMVDAAPAIAETQPDIVEPAPEIEETLPEIVETAPEIVEALPEIAAPLPSAAPAEEIWAPAAIEAAEEPLTAVIEPEVPEPASAQPVLADATLPDTEEVVLYLERDETNGQEPRPSKDDWTFFDPAQVRFAALLAKLDEIAGEAGDAR